MIDLDELEKLARAAQEDVDGPVWQKFWDQLIEDDVLTLIERVREAEAATERDLEAVKEHREKWMARAFRAETERDAALARVEELEAELEVAMRPHSECERSGAEAGERIVDLEARIAELEKELALLQVPEGYPKRPSARAWAEILDRANEAEARIAEAAKLHRRDSPGLGGEWCQSDGLKWPCPTAVALGLNEGEHDE